jgi:hypothetical protein
MKPGKHGGPGAWANRSEHGGSKLKTLFSLAIFAAMIFVCVKVVPPYFANYQFQDAIESESRFALSGYPKKTNDDIVMDVLKKAQELGIPAKADDVRLVINNTDVDISLDYSVPIDLVVYQFTLQFHPHADNHTI